MKMMRFLSLLSLFYGFATITFADEEPKGVCGKPADTPRGLFLSFHACWREANIDALKVYYTDETIYVNKDRTTVKGWDNIVKGIRRSSAAAGYTPVEYPYYEVAMNANGDMAMIISAWIMRNAEGEVMRRGTASEVYIKNAEGYWVYAIDDPSHPLQLIAE